MSRLHANPTWTALAVVAIAGTAWAAWAALGGSPASATAAMDPASARQHELIEHSLGAPGDATLGALYQQINAQHFTGSLPKIPVRWEPGLADVGRLAADSFTLEGLFGHLGTRSVILLNPALQTDVAATTRALCHEMVHAYLSSTGDVNENHGPPFQAVLRRLATEGAFEGTPATDEERTNLRAWLDGESARLDAEHEDMDREGHEIDQERAEIQQAMTAAANQPSSGDAASIAARRDAYNARAVAANDRLERDRADLAHFNAEVARYNLMLVYPDGLDSTALVKPKAAAGVSPPSR